jgi:diphthamide biosynthesis protein 7
MSTVQSLTSFKLDLPPSCIEFFPLKPEFAVIGTYNLENGTDEESAKTPTPKEGDGKSQQRNGSLILVKVDGDNVYAISISQ